MESVIKKKGRTVLISTMLVAAGLLVSTADAQTTGASGNQIGPVGDGSPAQVALNVILKPVRTLTVSHDQINLVYETANDYENGVSYTTTGGHLHVTNIGGGYKLFVKSSTPNLLGENGNQNTIDGSTVTITGLAQSGVYAYSRKINDINGGTNGAELFHHSENANVVDKAYDVEYKAAGDNAYMNKLFNGQQTKYTVNVVYTIVSE
ncbi:hypothetical protein [Parapedobacter koreensis]|uniref:Uncharacterized protein n=1 Tax=Parapedobacter koreensis TaxID=332977 RepID=A0A1H7SUL2_9SPHI|nr:hypothetical protein [Parapedobacter koreensis]SEL75776.1 hypothetical protein SAMN05421740_109183 [Parapedobacter koreensis]